MGMGMSSTTSGRKALAEGVFTLNKVMRDTPEQTIEIILDRYAGSQRWVSGTELITIW